jgi:hypothetical protein
VAYNNASVKVYWDPVPGAADYRIYDTASPNAVKYAGLFHGDSANRNGVATSEDWTGLGNGQPHTLVVQAVNQLGPVPGESLYTNSNTPLNPACAIGNGPLGQNDGKTADGMTSTNGQGPCTDNPQVIAQSPPFIVQANPSQVPIPSTGTASQTYVDTFADSEAASIKQTSLDATGQDMQTYSINAGTLLSAAINYVSTDTMHSYPFIHAHHFMDVLFDGGTPGSPNPLHTGYGTMSLVPNQAVTLGNGILHLTMEVDGHFSGRRWVSFILAPASDTITNFNTGNAISRTNRALFQYLLPQTCTLNIYTGGSGAPTGTAGGANGSALWGAAGQAPNGCYRNQNGLGIDNRSRFDFFISQTHAAFFEDGNLVTQSDIPAGSWPWATVPLKAWFSHYVYHTDNDITELQTYACFPQNGYWFNDPVSGSTTSCGSYPGGYGFPRSDERHWSNIGFEVLPGGIAPGSNYSSLAGLISMPQVMAPTFVSSRPGATATAIPTTATPTGAPAATQTPSPTTTAGATSLGVAAVSGRPSIVTAGSAATLSAAITPISALSNSLVDFQIFDGFGSKVYETWRGPINFTAHTARMVTAGWTVPSTQAVGSYRLKVGVYGTGRTPLYGWNGNAATITVRPPLVLGNFENGIDGFSHSANVTSLGPSTYAPAVAVGRYALWCEYTIPAAGAQAQIYKSVNLNLTTYSALSASTYPMQPTVAATTVQVRFEIYGADGIRYYSPFHVVLSGRRTVVTWNISAVPRSAVTGIYVDWSFVNLLASSGNQIYLDDIQAS